MEAAMRKFQGMGDPVKRAKQAEKKRREREREEELREERGPSAYFRIWIDGAGQGPDGTGSGYAFVRDRLGKKSTRVERIKRRDGLTNNQAEYRALVYALLNVPAEAEVEVRSDSQLVVNQVKGVWETRDRELMRLRNRVSELVDSRCLHFTIQWVPRERNLAGRLL
jgi:ribonuclease HI